MSAHANSSFFPYRFYRYMYICICICMYVNMCALGSVHIVLYIYIYLFIIIYRVSDVIGNNLTVKIASLRQAVFKSDERLRKAISITEYYDVLKETSVRTSKVIAKHNTEDEKTHTRTLERDRTDCNHYIPWQSFADVQIRKKRNSRAKKKSPRVSSRRLKRRNIKAPKNTPNTEDSNNEETAVPPPVINLPTSITLVYLRKDLSLFLRPVKRILRSFKKTFGYGKIGFVGLFIMT